MFTRQVLDYGFVRVVDTMGDDSAIVQAARVSYGDGTKTPSDDRSLIRYLMRHWHSTPFEMCEVKLHVKLPVFVARQWIRHRTANVNEYSARYSIMDREFYVPDPQNICSQSTINKQGGADPVEPVLADAVQGMFIDASEGSYKEYDEMLEAGVARETARMVLPINVYTQWYWKVDLHNLFHFLRLRSDPHAQYEIRVYADAIAEFVAQWVPEAWAAFQDYRLNAMSLSAMEVECMKTLLMGADPAYENMSGRERSEFEEKMKRVGVTDYD